MPQSEQGVFSAVPAALPDKLCLVMQWDMESLRPVKQSVSVLFAAFIEALFFTSNDEHDWTASFHSWNTHKKENL
jgi:hypothetical protein